MLSGVKSLRGDAAYMAAQWEGEIEFIDDGVLEDAELVVDTFFGAGLSRPIDGVVASVIDEFNRRAISCVAVDVPSGVRGDTWRTILRGAGLRAHRNVFSSKARSFSLSRAKAV